MTPLRFPPSPSIEISKDLDSTANHRFPTSLILFLTHNIRVVHIELKMVHISNFHGFHVHPCETFVFPRLLCLPWYNPQFYFIFNNKGTGTFYGLALRTLHGDPNFRVLTAPQQPTPSKFKVSSIVRFKLRTIYHLLGLHFSVFALTNWATTLVGPNKIHNYWNFMSNLFCISVSLYGLLYIFDKRFKPIIFSSFNELCSCEALV